MYKVIIHSRKDERDTTALMTKPRCTIGTRDSSDIGLSGWRIAKDHAVLEEQPDGVHIQGLSGKTVIVNGRKTEHHGPITRSDEVAIGDYRLRVEMVYDTSATTQTSGSANEPSALDLMYRSLRARLYREVMRAAEGRGEPDEQSVARQLDQALANLPSLPAGFNRRQLLEDVMTECTGYGVLDDLLQRDDVREIMVNSAQDIFYRTDDEVCRSRRTFSGDQALLDIIQRLLLPSGRHLSPSSPMVDARLNDGSRLNAVLPPLSSRGPSLTIRKMTAEQLSASHMINFETLSPAMLKFLETAVQQRKNIIIAGGTGTGKSTLLNILSRFIPKNERVVTIEDAAELDLPHPNLVALEARPPNPDGSGQITIRELVINSLRMSPDRIIIGECRGGEALDMLQAMNTGHDGSLTTLHANSPRDCLNRLEVLVLMSGIELPVTSIRSQISSAIDYIVQLTRFPCGSRKVTSIAEISGMDSQIIQSGEIYRFEQSGHNEKGKVRGQFVATGYVPKMMEQLREKGGAPDFSIFD